jgi:hypothetical protein
MNKEFTNEDIINAAKHCATNADCDNCPFFATLEIEGCIETFTQYIVNNTKKEPAPVATGTSSEVSKDTSSILHLDDSTKAAICQEAEKAYKACELILEIYERMDDSEQKAFELGHSYQVMSEVQEELARIGKGGEGNG